MCPWLCTTAKLEGCCSAQQHRSTCTQAADVQGAQRILKIQVQLLRQYVTKMPKAPINLQPGLVRHKTYQPRSPLSVHRQPNKPPLTQAPHRTNNSPSTAITNIPQEPAQSSPPPKNPSPPRAHSTSVPPPPPTTRQPTCPHPRQRYHNIKPSSHPEISLPPPTLPPY